MAAHGVRNTYEFPNTERPAKTTSGPSSSSIRNNRLYFASRSDRATEPILICPAAVATARSAIVVSSVSPERAETTVRKPCSRARLNAPKVSVSVPT